MTATYNFPGVTYGGQASPESLVGAIARINSLPTAADNSAAVISGLQATTIPVDARKMNGADIIGDGSELNPWRGVGVSP